MSRPSYLNSAYRQYASYVSSMASSSDFDMGTGSGRWIIVAVLVSGGGSTISAASASIGGVALTALTDSSLFDLIGVPGRYRYFYLQSDTIPTGAQPLSITLSGGSAYCEFVAVWGNAATAITNHGSMQGALHSGVDPRAVNYACSSDANSLCVLPFFMATSGEPTYTPTISATGGTTQRLWAPTLSGLYNSLVWTEDGAASTTLTGEVSGSQFSPNSFGLTFSVAGVVDVTNPTITGPSGSAGAASIALSMSESTTSVGTWSADESVTWSVTGPDSSLLSISGAGVVSLNSPFNYEAPVDAGADRTLTFTVTATDTSQNASSQSVVVTVLDANEAPTFAGPTISLPSGSAGSAISALDVSSRFSDPDSGSSITFSKGGSWPVSVTLSAGGVIGGTYPAVGTYAGLTVVAGSEGGLTVPSNTFSLSSTADGTNPSLTGSISVSNLTPTGYDFSWPVATDDVSVSGYEYSYDGGATWFTLGLVNTHSAAGRTPSTSDLLRVRAKDSTGNYSTPVLSATVSLPAAPDTTPPVFTGSVVVSAQGPGSYLATCPVATDVSAPLSYEYRINGGTWVLIPNGGRAAAVTGRPQGTDTIDFRAKDNAGNYSSNTLQASVSVSGPASYGFTSARLFFTTGSPVAQSNKQVHYSLFIGSVTGSLEPSFMHQGSGVTDAQGRLSVSGLSFSGVGELWMRDADGGRYFQNISVL